MCNRHFIQVREKIFPSESKPALATLNGNVLKPFCLYVHSPILQQKQTQSDITFLNNEHRTRNFEFRSFDELTTNKYTNDPDRGQRLIANCNHNPFSTTTTWLKTFANKIISLRYLRHRLFLFGMRVLRNHPIEIGC